MICCDNCQEDIIDMMTLFFFSLILIVLWIVANCQVNASDFLETTPISISTENRVTAAFPSAQSWSSYEFTRCNVVFALINAYYSLLFSKYSIIEKNLFFVMDFTYYYHENKSSIQTIFYFYLKKFLKDILRAYYLFMFLYNMFYSLSIKMCDICKINLNRNKYINFLSSFYLSSSITNVKIVAVFFIGCPKYSTILRFQLMPSKNQEV